MAGVPAGILSAMDEETKRGIVENILLSGLPITARTKGVINDLYVSNTDMQKGYGFSEIHSPVLVIHARDDPAGNFPRAPGIAAQIPRCTLIAIESGGHLLLGSEDYVKDVAYDTIMAEEERNGLQADSGSRLGDM